MLRTFMNVSEVPISKLEYIISEKEKTGICLVPDFLNLSIIDLLDQGLSCALKSFCNNPVLYPLNANSTFQAVTSKYAFSPCQILPEGQIVLD